MIRYDQMELHEPPVMIGDCMRAALASLLMIQPDRLPHFARWHYDDGLTPEEVEYRRREFMRSEYGFDVITIDPSQCEARILPATLCIASGESPRFPGTGHDVVWRWDAQGGELAHDPHPSRAGIVGKPWQVQFWMPVEPEAHKPEWRCFHCNEVFTNWGAARNHFGYTPEDGAPVCRVDGGTASTIYHLRRQVELLRRPELEATFQQRVEPWLLECFGAEIAGDPVERNHRFLEEALELVQACGCTASESHQLVDYVFGRPVGEKDQETGGAMVTLAALCRAQGIDMHEAGERELARIWTMVEKIRAKQAAKPKHSPLPGASA